MKDKGIFLSRVDLSFGILPLAIGLYKLTRNEEFLAFIEHSINALESTGRNVSCKDLGGIVSIPANQKAILNAAMLMQAFVPNRGWYDFREMKNVAQQITL